MSFRCRVSAISSILHSLSRPLKPSSITNCLVAIIHTKPVNSNCSPKIGCHGNQRTLGTRYQLCLNWIASPRKPTPRIKQLVASYHTTNVIAHKASYSKLRPKIGCHVNVLSTSGLPSNTWFLRPIWAHNPNSISIGSAVFAQMTAECPYTLQWDAPFPLKIAASHGGSTLWSCLTNHGEVILSVLTSHRSRNAVTLSWHQWWPSWECNFFPLSVTSAGLISAGPVAEPNITSALSSQHKNKTAHLRAS